MSSLLDDTCLVIPSKREPPIKSLEAFRVPKGMEVIVIADPAVFGQHQRYIDAIGGKKQGMKVVKGAIGMIPQSAQCYIQAAKAGYEYYFRIDDDLHPRTFVTKNGIVSLEKAIIAARECAKKLGTSLNGFCNTSRKDWLGEGFSRSYGLIHGGAHLCIAVKDPKKYIDLKLPAYEDVYRSAAHRYEDGAVGRVMFIGLDKRESLRDSSMSKTPAVQERAKKIILSKFPGMVTCTGYRTVDGGRQTIPNWRLQRGKRFWL